MKQTKEFDCVEMMHQGQTKAKERLKGKSREEVLAYHRQRAQEVRDEQERRKSEALSHSSLR
jgi:hypothetical protein